MIAASRPLSATGVRSSNAVEDHAPRRPGQEARLGRSTTPPLLSTRDDPRDAIRRPSARPRATLARRRPPSTPRTTRGAKKTIPLPILRASKRFSPPYPLGPAPSWKYRGTPLRAVHTPDPAPATESFRSSSPLTSSHPGSKPTVYQSPYRRLEGLTSYPLAQGGERP